jgi:hypothetical protein
MFKNCVNNRFSPSECETLLPSNLSEHAQKFGAGIGPGLPHCSTINVIKIVLIRDSDKCHKKRSISAYKEWKCIERIILITKYHVAQRD